MSGQMNVHSILPGALTAAVAGVLDAAGVEHLAHGEHEPMRAAEAAAAAPRTVALVGPYRSAVAPGVVAAPAPAGLPLHAPTRPWAGVARHVAPGGDDAA